MPVDVTTIIIFDAIVIAIYMPLLLIGNKPEKNIKTKGKDGEEVSAGARNTLRIVTFIALLTATTGMIGDIIFSYRFFKHQDMVAGVITVLLAMNHFLGDFPFRKENIEKRMEERW